MKLFFFRSLGFVNGCCLVLIAAALACLPSCNILSKPSASKTREISAVARNAQSIQAKQKQLYDLTEKDFDNIQNIKDVLTQNGVRIPKPGDKAGNKKKESVYVVLKPNAVLELQRQLKKLEQSKRKINKLQNDAMRNCDSLNRTALVLRSIEHGEALERKRYKKNLFESAKELVTTLSYFVVLCIIGLGIFKIWKK